MKTQFNNSGFTFIVYIVSTLFCVATGYLFIQSMEYISTNEHWRFNYALISFLLALTLLWALIFSSIYNFFSNRFRNDAEKKFETI